MQRVVLISNTYHSKKSLYQQYELAKQNLETKNIVEAEKLFNQINKSIDQLTLDNKSNSHKFSAFGLFNSTIMQNDDYFDQSQTLELKAKCDYQIGKIEYLYDRLDKAFESCNQAYENYKKIDKVDETLWEILIDLTLICQLRGDFDRGKFFLKKLIKVTNLIYDLGNQSSDSSIPQTLSHSDLQVLPTDNPASSSTDIKIESTPSSNPDLFLKFFFIKCIDESLKKDLGKSSLEYLRHYEKLFKNAYEALENFDQKCKIISLIENNKGYRSIIEICDDNLSQYELLSLRQKLYLHNSILLCALKIKDLKKAGESVKFILQHLQDLKDISPTIYLNLGLFYESKKDLKALDFFLNFKERIANDENLKAQFLGMVHKKIADFYLKNRQVYVAKEHYFLAIKGYDSVLKAKTIDHGICLREVANLILNDSDKVFLEIINRMSTVLTIFEKNLHPDHPLIILTQYDIAKIYYQFKYYENALIKTNELIEKDHNFLFAYKLKMDIYKDINQYDGFTETHEQTLKISGNLPDFIISKLSFLFENYLFTKQPRNRLDPKSDHQKLSELKKQLNLALNVKFMPTAANFFQQKITDLKSYHYAEYQFSVPEFEYEIDPVKYSKIIEDYIGKIIKASDEEFKVNQEPVQTSADRAEFVIDYDFQVYKYLFKNFFIITENYLTNNQLIKFEDIKNKTAKIFLENPENYIADDLIDKIDQNKDLKDFFENLLSQMRKIFVAIKTIEDDNIVELASNTDNNIYFRQAQLAIKNFGRLFKKTADLANCHFKLYEQFNHEILPNQQSDESIIDFVNNLKKMFSKVEYAEFEKISLVIASKFISHFDKKIIPLNSTPLCKQKIQSMVNKEIYKDRRQELSNISAGKSIAAIWGVVCANDILLTIFEMSKELNLLLIDEEKSGHNHKILQIIKKPAQPSGDMSNSGAQVDCARKAEQIFAKFLLKLQSVPNLSDNEPEALESEGKLKSSKPKCIFFPKKLSQPSSASSTPPISSKKFSCTIS